MDLFISSAWAQQAAGGPQDPGIAGLLFPLVIIAVFFFLFILPQQRRGREHKKMLEALSKGTEIVTNGGLVGKVLEVDDSFVQIEIADDVQVQIQKQAIASLLPKGTFKALKRSAGK